MAYNYIDEKSLRDALQESEAYMKPLVKDIPELERITDGRPGKVPKGKPRVTDGTSAGLKRETPKQVIQQIPTGKVVIRQMRDQEETVSAILTDIILPNANDGGTPYDKAKLGIEDCFPIGSAWYHVFFNRTGDLMHADYRLVDGRYLLFPKGKVSEFNLPYVGIIEYMTKDDIKYELWRCNYLKKQAEERGEKYEGHHHAKHWQALLDSGADGKDEEHKTAEEKKQSDNDGYFKTVKWMQRGTGATFYRHAPKIDEVLGTEVSKDPRGVIPLHGLVPLPSKSNPLGRPLIAISAGKQNLLDFRMQMEQYREGHGLSPTLLLYGSTPKGRVKTVPDHIIQMNGTPQTDRVEPLNLATDAGRNYANDSSYIKTQIFNEQGGSNDSSVSSEAGSVGFSKTDSGVKAQQARTSVSKDDLRRGSEQLHERIFETLLNIHVAESQGVKTLELQDETMKRLKLEEDPVMDYDQDFGKIRFSVDAGTAQAADNERENEKLIALQEVKAKQPDPDDKDMHLFNQTVKNAGVDNPEKIMYTDEEIEAAKARKELRLSVADTQLQMQQQQLLNPPQPQAPVEGEVLPPEQAMPMDPAQEDREMAKAQLMERMGEQEAEAVLQGMDSGQL